VGGGLRDIVIGGGLRNRVIDLCSDPVERHAVRYHQVPVLNPGAPVQHAQQPGLLVGLTANQSAQLGGLALTYSVRRQRGPHSEYRQICDIMIMKCG
jgi:hypothetical protein